MADEMDPCECLWNHELAMRRLITLLRQGQSYCTESECLESLPSVPGAGGSTAGQGFLVLFLTLAFAVAMYALTPRRRAITHEPSKPAPHQDHDDGAPPTPPRV